MVQQIENLASLHQGYDAVLSDVWGVLHNGVVAWPDACEALSRARADGLSVVLITNSPRPHKEVILQLDGIGVPRGAYDRIVTSGDVTRKLIEAGPKKVFFLGLDRDLTLLEGLGVEVVDKDEAQAVVCTGPYDDENDKPDDYRDMFAPWVERDVPFICANPDLIVERGDRLVLCAGALAAVYSEMGGETRITGKPYPAMYDAALAFVSELKPDVAAPRAIAIGDGLPTDVKGAQDYGLDLLYIANGIHARDYAEAGRIDAVRLASFLEDNSARPHYWMPALG
ncbi:TIGR01459 family HAD-type hydrolase [Georhizobium sp. MAB10]|uniref:TIGR01459 family HAD-type hydrolase n=1 Tax=Georhizobium sp. MAB10 TaxID=3028319 RepID=UPI0038559184